MSKLTLKRHENTHHRTSGAIGLSTAGEIEYNTPLNTDNANCALSKEGDFRREFSELLLNSTARIHLSIQRRTQHE